MREPNQEVFQKVSQWLNYADEDLHLAKHGLIMESSCPYRLIAYHAQQCAEKHLKAYLVYKGVDFPYTYNISRLLELCGEQGENWPKTLEDAEELTPFAITTRYPGEDTMVTREEAVHAIKIAEQVRDTVITAFKQQGYNV